MSRYKWFVATLGAVNQVEWYNNNNNEIINCKLGAVNLKLVALLGAWWNENSLTRDPAVIKRLEYFQMTFFGVMMINFHFRWDWIQYFEWKGWKKALSSTSELGAWTVPYRGIGFCWMCLIEKGGKMANGGWSEKERDGGGGGEELKEGKRRDEATAKARGLITFPLFSFLD